MPLPDAHIHLQALGLAQTRPSLCVTCTPSEFEAAQARYRNVALGLHPWQVTASNAEELLQGFCKLLPKAQVIGEVGLDSHGAYAQSYSAQLYVFQSICTQLAKGSYLVSIHSRNAGTGVLEVLERSGAAASSTCIMHGFNGSSRELSWARELGCLFSFGARELKTRRGREYARQLPRERILLETDADGSRPFTLAEWDASLEEALSLLEEIRGAGMRSVVEDNFSSMLSRHMQRVESEA